MPRVLIPSGNPQKRTNRSFLESALANVEEAAHRLAKVRQLYDATMPGDPAFEGTHGNPGLRQQIIRARSDERHWRGEVAFWRGQCVAEGNDFVPAMQWTPPRQGTRVDPLSNPKVATDPIVQAELAARERRRQELAQLAKQAAREVGADDADGELPF